VLLASRNIPGIDVICFRDGARPRSIQVKTLSKRNPVPLGKSLDGIVGDFCVVVTLDTIAPKTYILRPGEVRARAERNQKGSDVSYWLSPRDYAVDDFEGKWQRMEEAVT